MGFREASPNGANPRGLMQQSLLRGDSAVGEPDGFRTHNIYSHSVALCR